ncbi:M1 family metallopeptidase [Rhodohalobacter mucosus]|uniref:Peptidase M1 n=1 Tax=Rhodohalobacter mucosus TaxID=2079485 RepID=A0A316TWC2_9BACT|nr:M1 family metallopeptidase [Rhodohalobacter mucosus]PWN07679.1 peptidase M1 [Rhodohalobacter mucosus]
MIRTIYKTTFTLLLSLLGIFILSSATAWAQQAGYWQQEVEYEMDIDFNVETNRFDGFQKLTYHNHSPDTLNRVFYHLFFNAFQPNSMMDVRSRTIADPDRRIRDRIFHYDETEIGYQRVDRLTQNGSDVEYTIEGTIMEVHLNEPVAPGESVVFEMDFNAQVPLQTRRSGRDNAEGVRYSMSQWYPKIAAYDEMGWHANPYIGREFYAPFGTFDIKIHIDRDYVVASGSILQNPEEVGYGYETPGIEVNRPDGEKLTWHFTAENVHDVMWAADPDYTHTTAQVPGGPLLRFFYQSETVAENASDDEQAQLLDNWEALPELTVQGFRYMSENYGDYPYEEYVVVQGGDGGMEYTMGTLITGNRSLRSLVGVTVHEFVHAWYEGAVGNNEVYDQWIDEGFTTYFSAFITNHLFNNGEGDPMLSRYNSYFRVVQAGIEEPMHKHSDHYVTNTAYGMASYTKGAMFLHQLGYVIGDEVLKNTLNRFYDEWKFKHPSGYDFLRIAEEESGMNLKWYYEYWVTTTQTIDYGVAEVTGSDQSSVITLAKNSTMPMPLDVRITYTDGSQEWHYIPLRIMWGEKENPYPDASWNTSEDWPWVFPEYELSINRPLNEIARVEIDPSMRMADVNRNDNVWAPVSDADSSQDAGRK